jgi:predicted TIM-barrel fold metal-dependent hydrolase
VENMMWATDFPHHATDWPHSRDLIDKMFAGVPEEDEHRVVCANAVDFYKLDAK